MHTHQGMPDGNSRRWAKAGNRFANLLMEACDKLLVLSFSFRKRFKSKT
jgi:hypothetical protein